MEKGFILDEDNFVVPEVGRWSHKKYRLVQYYAQIFATGMKYKWDRLIYLDLFAGAGRAKIKDTSRIVDTSPLLALNIPDKFDLYIFCDKDSTKLQALKSRVQKRFPSALVQYIDGDVNLEADRICSEIPRGTKDFRVLSFCVVDPFKMSDLKFSTINRLSEFYIDYLVLIPTHMDANRNENKYVSPRNNTICEFLGDPQWRNDWYEAKIQNIPFPSFVLNSFGIQMERLNFLSTEICDTELVCLPGKNVPLYRLAFYSRSKLGIGFWEQAKKYSNPQKEFEFKWER